MHPLRNIYNHMIRRCYEKTGPRFKDWGGRGITVCERWLGRDGFANFLADMGTRPSPKHSIDRIDNDGNYEPSNCRWATATQQTRNSRHANIIEVNGERKHLRDWAREKGMLESTLCNRLLRSGWDPERAINAPVDVHVPRGFTRIDLTGNRYGRLFVLGYAGSATRNGKKFAALWRVRCDCGTEKIVRGGDFKRKLSPTRSCGCAKNLKTKPQ